MSSLDVQRLSHDVFCLDANYVAPGLACFYLIRGGDDYAVIETGTANSLPVLEHCLERENISASQLKYVVPTHAHLDHAGGAGAIMEAYPQATMLAHPSALRHLVDPSRLVASSKQVYGEEAFLRLYGEIKPVPGGRARALADGESFTLGDRQILARHTPGHADHHLCLWDERSSGWFTGDMFGVCYPSFRFESANFVMPSTTPTQFDPRAFEESLGLLAAAAPERLYLTHFGELPFRDEALQLLKEQVRHYAELARQTGSDVAALASALHEYTLAKLGEYVPAAEARKVAELLGTDVSLNAQGLSIWLQRQAA